MTRLQQNQILNQTAPLRSTSRFRSRARSTNRPCRKFIKSKVSSMILSLNINRSCARTTMALWKSWNVVRYRRASALSKRAPGRDPSPTGKTGTGSMISNCKTSARKSPKVSESSNRTSSSRLRRRRAKQCNICKRFGKIWTYPSISLQANCPEGSRYRTSNVRPTCKTMV